ncbi:hypothetical protein P170DRAFT_469471 [Aspergillus steynii IBT 23096]|uniref:N-acetyltransferase domain-containing protein n=1 Tax=Aspergillus steynii IBT 23096 TaxID=1392250 RepID=A0A2I2GM94_9EURO|nr:uncharacterized protein P170DRAFT_469471 [Aspergillus steynii IBT 23096]PLB53997.1 hypothetical protein P170DRAFT_469471 [Aspergillus steynii IBT 23096]
MGLPLGFTLSPIPTSQDAGISMQSIENFAIQTGPDDSLSRLLWPGRTMKKDDQEDADEPFHTVEMLSEPTNFYLWIIDDKANHPVAYAWGQYTTGRTEVEWAQAYAKRYRPEGINKPLMDATSGARFLKRASILGSSDCFIIKELYVLPEYQRRGLGGVLMERMVPKADELGLPGYLESSTVGYGLYIKHGFEEVGRITVDLEQWGGEKGEENTYVLMLRSAERLNV